MDAPPEALLLVVDAGGGHRAAANALLAAAERVRQPFRLRVESLQAIFEPLDLVRRLTGLDVERFYNAMVRRGLTWHLVPLLHGLQWAIARMHGPLVRRLAAHLSARRPDVVVSLAPNFNGVIRDAVRSACPHAPFVVLLTDLADFPPHFWMEPGLDGVIVGTEAAAGQAREVGLPESAIDRTSGMVLHPRFYAAVEHDARARVRAGLGIPSSAFTVLLLFGGKGAPLMAPLAARLLDARSDWHLVAVCGDNPRLCARMARLERHAGGRLHPLGFTDRVPELMRAADLLLTKPGPGSLAEAFHYRVPVVVTLDARTIPQERFNARFVAEQGVGVVVRSWRDMAAAAARVASEPGRLEALHGALARLPDNRAVWEALDLIAARLPRHRHGRVIAAG